MGFLVQKFCKNASRFVDVAHGMELAGRTVMPTKGLLVKKRHTVDTHENRYVKWTMERVCARLQHLQQVLQRSGYKYGVDTYGDVLALIARMEDTLRKRLHHPFWREVGKLDRSIGSLVLQMAPGYREVYQIHTILSQSIVLQGELYKMSVKDIATLYEYWTFLKLGQIVGRTCEALHQDVVQVRQDGLFVNLDTSKSAVRTYQHPVTGEEIILTYQYRTHKSIEKVNIGGLPFLPNATGLVEEMVYNLLNRSADELQRNGILPIGTKEYFQYREDEQVLVVRVCAEDVDGVLKKRAVFLRFMLEQIMEKGYVSQRDFEDVYESQSSWRLHNTTMTRLNSLIDYPVFAVAAGTFAERYPQSIVLNAPHHMIVMRRSDFINYTEGEY